MQNLKFAAATDLVPNIWNIYEPSHDELVETEMIDMVLVPLLCFDKRGYRVGYGKGFYDRFFEQVQDRLRKDWL
jgi:5-formyltetrahydrofolate cyclo-ligase